MWRRNAIHDSNKTLRLQKLRIVSNPTRTHGIEGEIETENGIERRRTGQSTQRIPQMVAQQKEVIERIRLLDEKTADSMKSN